MLFWYFLLVIAFIALVFASIVDIKTREVPNWLSYSLIIIGLGSRLIYSLILSDFSFILYGLLGLAVFFVFANFMYYTKQWGGGDGKLLMGLGAMFGSYNSIEIFNIEYHLPFLASLLINILISGTVYGIIYSLFLGLKNKEKFLKELKKRDLKGIKIISLLIAVLLIISFFIFDGYFYNIFFIMLIVILSAYILLFIMRVIEDSSLYKVIKVSRLTEGDWLAGDVTVKRKLICKARNIGLTKEDIKLLKKNNIKEVLVKEGIPFVPGFLIGFLATIFLGDLIFLFI